MAKTKVQVELSSAQEIALMSRYGRKCSAETLVKRALAEVLKQQAEAVPIFVGARVKAEDEANRLAVEELLARFRAGEKFVDLEGRAVSALEPNEDVEVRDHLPVIIQVDSDDSTWFPVELRELKPAVNTFDGDGKLTGTGPLPGGIPDVPKCQ